MTRIDNINQFRVQGPVISIAELAKSKPGFVVQAKPEQVAELAQHAQQTQAREAAGELYARQHPANIYAQIVLNGTLQAIVYDTGVAGTTQNISGLHLTEDGEGLSLAKTRLAELAKALKGEVIYGNFIPMTGPAPSVVPDAALPDVTARSLTDIMRDMEWALARSNMALSGKE